MTDERPPPPSPDPDAPDSSEDPDAPDSSEDPDVRALLDQHGLELEDLEAYEHYLRRRRRVLGVVAAVVVVVASLLFILVPRTVASEGGFEGADVGADVDVDAGAWSLRASTGFMGPTVRLVTDEGATTLLDAGRARLADTTIVYVEHESVRSTVVVGHTPHGAQSIRIGSVERGVGEASIHRIGWRRLHVAVLPGNVWVTDLVAIGSDGSVHEVVDNLRSPERIDVERGR